MSDASDKAVGAFLQQQIDGEWRPLCPISLKSYAQWRLVIAHLTGSSSQCTSQSSTSGIWWKAVSSTWSRITNPSHSLWQPHPINTLPVTSYTWTTSHNLLQTFGTSQVSTTQWPMHFRNAVNTVHNIQSSQVDLQVLAQTQTSDPELQALLNLSSTSLQLKTLPLPASSSTMICDMSIGSPRPFVPTPPCRTVFTALHSLAHPGVRATQQLIAEWFVWPGMRKDIKSWTRTCILCQRSKVQRHNITPLSSFKTPDTIRPDPHRHRALHQKGRPTC